MTAMPDERPASMGQALEMAGFDEPENTGTADAEPLAQGEADSSSATDVPPASDAAPAAATPRASSPATEPTPSGPIPVEDHQRIVKGFHEKLDAAQATLKDLSWAQQVPAGMGPKILAMAAKVHGDPVGFLMELAAEVQADPTHAAALKSHAGRLLGTRGAPAASAPPVADLPLAARSGVPEVDAVLDARDRYLAETLAGQVAEIIQQQVAPISAVTGRIQAAEQRQQAEADAKTFAETEFAKVQALPGFLENAAAIAEQFEAEMAKIPLADQDRLSPVVLRDVWAAIAIPKLTSQSNSALLGKLQAKAVAGSLGTQPTVGSSPQRPRSMAEALAQAGV